MNISANKDATERYKSYEVHPDIHIEENNKMFYEYISLCGWKCDSLRDRVTVVCVECKSKFSVRDDATVTSEASSALESEKIHNICKINNCHKDHCSFKKVKTNNELFDIYIDGRKVFDLGVEIGRIISICECLMLASKSQGIAKANFYYNRGTKKLECIKCGTSIDVDTRSYGTNVEAVKKLGECNKHKADFHDSSTATGGVDTISSLQKEDRLTVFVPLPINTNVKNPATSGAIPKKVDKKPVHSPAFSEFGTRLNSYTTNINWDHSLIDEQLFARDGFFCIGDRSKNVIICFNCGLMVDAAKIKHKSNPRDLHHQASIHCSHSIENDLSFDEGAVGGVDTELFQTNSERDVENMIPYIGFKGMQVAIERNRAQDNEYSENEGSVSDDNGEDDDDVDDIDDEVTEFDVTDDSDSDEADSSSDESNTTSTTNLSEIDIQLPPTNNGRYNLRRSSTPYRSKINKPEEFERAIEKEREKQKCVVCQDSNKSVLILPCRHMCLCVQCGNHIARSRNVARRVCPLCRNSIKTIMNVYV